MKPTQLPVRHIYHRLCHEPENQAQNDSGRGQTTARNTKLGLLVVLAALACSASTEQEGDEPAEVLVVSSESIDVSALNSAIDAAIESEQPWTSSAAQVTLNILGWDSETRDLSLSQHGNRGESPDTMTVVLTRDGFLDDAVRGDWYRLILHRTSDGTWRVVEGQRAHRCRRGEDNGYRAGPCP